MKESDHKRKLVAEINAIQGAYARRIEDRWAVGVLDLIFKLPALPWTFAEGKLIDGNLFAPTERQFEEGQRIMRAGGVVILLGWKAGELYASPWVKLADVRTCYHADRHLRQVTVLREYLTFRQKEKLDELG